jgi:hypothetical protein
MIRGALFVGVLLCGIAAGPVAAQTSCLTVNIARPLVFPDGTEHAGGRLVLCDWKAFTPVTHLHRSYVDGDPIQMLMGKRTTNERPTDAPDEVFFQVDSLGRLELIGYARTFRGRGLTVRFQRQNSPRNVDRLARALKNDDLMIVMARPH